MQRFNSTHALDFSSQMSERPVAADVSDDTGLIPGAKPPSTTSEASSTISLGEVDAAFHIVIDELEFNEKVGEGATADVFKGLWRTQVVAIKRMRAAFRPKTIVQQEVAFKRETLVATRVIHPNLVQLFGMVLEEQNLLMVSEFCAGGTCYELLQNNDFDLLWVQKFKMIRDVADAMTYLHRFRPQIIHRDLKSLNLLLRECLRRPEDMPHVKVSDFGFARMRDEEAGWVQMTPGAGTFHWMAPEVYTGRYNEKADVYSFAMVLFEIVSQEVPFEDLEGKQVQVAVMKGERPDRDALPPECPEELERLMQQCWAQSPDYRPSFPIISKALEVIPTPKECRARGRPPP